MFPGFFIPYAALLFSVQMLLGYGIYTGIYLVSRKSANSKVQDFFKVIDRLASKVFVGFSILHFLSYVLVFLISILITSEKVSDVGFYGIENWILLIYWVFTILFLWLGYYLRKRSNREHTRKRTIIAITLILAYVLQDTLLNPSSHPRSLMEEIGITLSNLINNAISLIGFLIILYAIRYVFLKIRS